MSVLDIGFGTGFPLTELAMRFGNTCTLFGIDPWEAAADRVREKIRIYGISNVKLIIGKAEVISLEDNSIDLITSNNGLNNVEDLPIVLSECYRVLKPGGKLIFTMNTRETMLEFYNMVENTMTDHGLSESVNDLKQHIYDRRKPIHEIRNLLVKHGFSSIDIEKDKFCYKFSDGTAMFNHFFIRLAFLDSWREIVPEKEREMIFSEVENRLNLIAPEKGHLSLSVPFALFEAKKV